MVDVYKIGVRITADARPAVEGINLLIEYMGKLVRAEREAEEGLDRLIDRFSSLRRRSGAVRSVADEFDKVGGAAKKAADSVENFNRIADGAHGHRSGSNRRGHAIADAEMVGFTVAAGGAGAARLIGSADAKGFTTDTLLSILASDTRITAAQRQQAYDAAYDATRSASGTRINTNLEALIDLKNVTGSFDEARAALPAFSKMTARLQALDQKRGGDGDEAYAAAKAMDILGGMIDGDKIDPKLMQSRLDKMTRVDIATNGRVDPEQYLGFAKQARSAGMMLSDEFIYERLPAIIQNIGGQRAGTALMSLSQVYQGDRLTDKSYDALAALGLAPERSVTEGKKGGLKRGKQGKLYDLDLMGSDPLSYVQKAEARMEARGIHGRDAQLRALANAQQRSTMAGLLADLVKDMPAILKDQESIRHTNIAGVDKNAASSVNRLTSAWENLLTVSGNANTKDAVSLLDHLSTALDKIGEAEKRHPNATRYLMDISAGLAALGVAAGAAFIAIAPILAAKGLLKYLKSGSGKVAEAAVGAGEVAAEGGAKTAGRWLLGGAMRAAARLSPWGLALYEMFDSTPTNTNEAAILRQVWEREHPKGSAPSNTQQAHITIQPAPIILDGKQIGQAVFNAAATQTRQSLRSTSSGADGLAMPQYPGAALAH